MALLASSMAACTRDPERGPIIWLNGEDTSQGQQLHALVDQWNDQHPGEEVSYKDLDHGTDDQRLELLEAATGSNRSDVFGLDVIWVPEFARAGFLRELDPNDIELNAFVPKTRAPVQTDGKTWAIPACACGGLLYYRKDLLAEVGRNNNPPRTWTELVKISQEVSKKHPEVGGYAGQYDRYEGLVVNVFEAVWAQGGELVSTDGNSMKVMVDSPQARAGLQFMVNMKEKKIVPARAQPFKEEEGIRAFADGQLVFLRGWPSTYARLIHANQSQVSQNFGVTTLPGPTVLGGSDLAISSRSRHPKTALDFIKFMTSEDAERQLLIKAAEPPSRSALYEDRSLLKDPKNAYLGTLEQAIEKARPRPLTERYADISQAVSTEVYELLFADQPLELTIDKLKDRLYKIPGASTPPARSDLS
jgi:multiple sugar transport system substrate-binding protein